MNRKLLLVVLMVALLAVMTAALATADEHVAMVSVGHGIPGDDLGMDAELPVDVIVNDDCFLQDLEFGDFEGPVELEPDPTVYSVAVALSDGDDETCDGDVVIGPVDLTFEGGSNVTVFAHLSDAGAPMASVFENDVEDAVAGHTRLDVRHAANAPAVEIDLFRGWIRGRSMGTLELANGEQPEDALDLRPGAYAVSIYAPSVDVTAYETEPSEQLVTKPHVLQNVYAVGTPGEDGTFMLLVETFDLGHTPPPRPMPPGG